MHGDGNILFRACPYLAEDGILCWELVSKGGASRVLHCVKVNLSFPLLPLVFPLR